MGEDKKTKKIPLKEKTPEKEKTSADKTALKSAVESNQVEKSKNKPSDKSVEASKSTDETISGEKSDNKPSDKSVEASKSTDETISGEKSDNKPSDKSVEAPKSASQRSISHFSSVSTKEYRSGWAKIFDKKKTSKNKSK